MVTPRAGGEGGRGEGKGEGGEGGYLGSSRPVGRFLVLVTRDLAPKWRTPCFHSTYVPELRVK